MSVAPFPTPKGETVAVRADYEARNARGVVLCTFADLALARAWVRERAVEHDGLHVEEVITTIIRRRAYQPRAHLRVVA